MWFVFEKSQIIELYITGLLSSIHSLMIFWISSSIQHLFRSRIFQNIILTHSRAVTCISYLLSSDILKTIDPCTYLTSHDSYFRCKSWCARNFARLWLHILWQTHWSNGENKKKRNYVFENFVNLCTCFVIFNVCNKQHLFVLTNWLIVNIIGMHIIFYCLLTVSVRRRVHTFPFIPYNINFVHRGLTEDATFIYVTSALYEGIKYYKRLFCFVDDKFHIWREQLRRVFMTAKVCSACLLCLLTWWPDMLISYRKSEKEAQRSGRHVFTRGWSIPYKDAIWWQSSEIRNVDFILKIRIADCVSHLSYSLTQLPRHSSLQVQ